ncbi:hypothetical protein BDY19DRAFT_926005 [Irpex rosettiformis]|uniref:Uncharacterized protein n=1 Tax=Irpex rosettiformis TaxID=378272 RepID=A0ACB8UEP9_9APHY|nr:hypothetical protein BDY19DRAFT_926005 [Irpex rosettiformis]
METPSPSQRLGQPSNSFSAYAHPMASPIAPYSPLYPQSPLVDVSLSEKANLQQHYQQSASVHSYPTSGQPSQWRSQYPVCPETPSASSLYNSRSACSSSIAYTRPRGLRIANLLKPWIPIILYAVTTLGFVAAISFWKAEVFQGLDDFSHWLKSDEYVGYATIFTLIFITTFPPLPLYSTFIVLSGYTFGTWTGAVISYVASLAGALVVFGLSRMFFYGHISKWLSCTPTIKRVVRAIEKRPELLFLIRLAPYPYNVMNCLLAAAPTLTLKTYMTCTSLSLFKLAIHTSIGSSIHSFAQYHVVKPGQTGPDSQDESTLAHYSTIIGVVLCIGILAYLSYVARKAVDEELEDELALPRDSDETVSFLSDQDSHDQEMEEVDCRPASRSPSRPPSRVAGGDRWLYAGQEEACVGL